MTERIFLDTKHLVIKALLVSFLGHIVCFSLFTFTFPARFASKKPLLVFLGSILRITDVSRGDGESTGDETGKISATFFNPRIAQDSQAIPHISTAEKPLLAQPPAQNSKKLFKPPITDSVPVATKNKTGGEPSYDSVLPPRIPLKLDQK